jgi:hypothetical protein
MNEFHKIIRNIWGFVKELWKSFWTSFDNSEKEIPPASKEQIAEQLQREIARPSELGIASTDTPKYQKSRSLLSKSEHILHQALLRAINDEHVIHPKVRMGDFVYLANEPQDRKFHVNQVLCKHVDFLFCDKRTLEPLLVVELDDSSHKQYVQSERDEFKNKTFTAVGLPYLRIAIQQEYDLKSLQSQIEEKIGH